MNDFTKEELMNILYSLEHLYEPTFDLTKMYLLRNKVESMIDNHDKPCEHKNIMRIQLLQGSEYNICKNCEHIRQMR